MLYFFFKLWEHRIINLSCFCTHEKVFLLTAYRCVMQKSRLLWSVHFFCLNCVVMHGKMCTGNIRHAWLLILRSFKWPWKPSLLSMNSNCTFFFILYAFVAWVLVGNRNVVGISMNDSGLEFDLENTLMYWSYMKYSSKMNWII